MNLIGNSVDAVAGLSKKWITIEYKQMEKSCILYFTDSGEGIKPEVASKMMNPFFSTKEVGKGTGLGLSISMGIIESHGGRLFYEKRNGNTCFVVEIPLASLSSVSESE